LNTPARLVPAVLLSALAVFAALLFLRRLVRVLRLP